MGKLDPMSHAAGTQDFRAPLSAFRQTLAKEAHVLTRCPDLLWQQFFNRLKWEDGPIRGLLGHNLGQRAGPGAAPWIRTRIPLPDSEALIRTLRSSKATESESRVFLCSFAPDGSRVVSQDSSWDSETGKELPALFDRSDGGLVYGVSEDHGRLITVDGGLCKVWETRSAREVATCSAHYFQAPSVEALSAIPNYFPRACAFSPDGRWVVTGCAKFYAIWDANTGEVLTKTSGNRAILGCAFSPDGGRVATTDDWGRCTILSLSAGAFNEHTTVLEISEGLMTDCAFSPDGTRLVTGTTEGPAVIWHTGTRERLATLRGHSGAVLSCVFSPDGSRILTGGKDGSTRLWAADSGEEMAVLKGHDQGVDACAFSPDGYPKRNPAPPAEKGASWHRPLHRGPSRRWPSSFTAQRWLRCFSGSARSGI